MVVTLAPVLVMHAEVQRLETKNDTSETLFEASW